MIALPIETIRSRLAWSEAPGRWTRLLPAVSIVLPFAVLFARPFTTLLRDWWALPEAGHGLLLAPIAIAIAFKAGIHPQASRNFWLGALLLSGAVLLRVASGLAAELFTMRVSMIGALVGITVYYGGLRQARHWWLPFVLLVLAIPLPELVTQALALPLQFKASELGSFLLRTRGIPVLLTGNVIRIPGHELFVTEACSGLRSLSALVSMAILVGALFLRTAVARIALLLIAIPIAIVVNGVRVFLTGFLVHFASPSLGTGFMQATEGWLLFLVSLAGLAASAAMWKYLEGAYDRRRQRA